LALAEQNHVTLSYRGSSLVRVFRENLRRLAQAVAAGRVRVIYRSRVAKFGERTCTLEIEEQGTRRTLEVPYDHAFVLIGAEAPADFLRSLGIRMENEWAGNPLSAALLTLATLGGLWLYGGHNGLGALAAAASVAGLILSGRRGNRWAWLGVSFLAAYTIYGVKQEPGREFWPYTGWGFEALSFLGRPWSFWYSALYTAVMTVFGLRAMKRWGFDRGDKFQIWRYTSLLGVQWIFFFLVPEFLFRWAVEYRWVGERLASDPSFAGEAWRSYGLLYAWPLFFYTFFGHPHRIWVVWGVLLSFVILPAVALFHGKRYCTWVCGCGGLAETLGDRWRHLAPKGRSSLRWERMNLIVLAAAAVITLMMVIRDAVTVLRAPAEAALQWYHLAADVWLVGILPVTLYPFFGGKIWCRYWCPLAKMMELFSALYARLGLSRFAIHANDKCIACGECSRYCQVGIDVMSFALQQKPLTNANSSCIGCGICVTVCPMDTLSFRAPAQSPTALVQIGRL
jgi:polyferredoxin